MGYIGKKPATQGKDAGPALKLDDISSDFNGLTTVFELTVNGTAVDPHINNIQVYLGGVHQIPGSSFSLSGSQIVFTGAPSSSLGFHGNVIGDSRLFIPDNDTVEPASFTANTRTHISGSFISGFNYSGTISGSSTSTASFGRLEVAGNTNLTGDIEFDDVTATGNITSTGTNKVISGSITSTGSFGRLVVGDNIDLVEDQKIHFEADKLTYVESHASDSLRAVVNNRQMFLLDEDTGNRAVFGNETKVFIGANNNQQPTSELEVDGTISGSTDLYIGDNITYVSASGGNIFATGNISGSATSTGSFGRVNSTTIDIDSIQGNWTNAGNTVADLGVITTADINGGTIDGITSLTAGGNLDIGTHDFRARKLTADNQTSGNVAIYSTAGLLSEDSDLTFSGATLSATNVTTTGTIKDFASLSGSAVSTGSIGRLETTSANALIGGNVVTIGGALTTAGTLTTQNNNVTINAVGAARTLTLNESLTVGDGHDGTITFGAASKTLTIENTSLVNQDLTTDASPTFAGATITGTLTVQEVHTEFESASILFTSGSTQLGNSTDDVHNVTGSMKITGSFQVDNGTLTAGTVDINGGTVDGITSLTAGGDLDIGSHDFRAATLTADGLTATRVPFAGSNGLLSDDSDLTFATATLSATNLTTTGTIKNMALVSGSSVSTGSFGRVQTTTAVSSPVGKFTTEVSSSSGKFTTVDIDGGTINGITDLAVADGGTGVSTLTDGGVLLGSGTSGITAMSVLADSEMIVGDGSTDPVAESGATLRTSIGVGTTDNVKFANITGSNNISASGNLSITGNVDVDGTSNFAGAVTLNDSLDLQDNDKILIGTGDDLEIFFDGTNSQIHHTPGSGQMFISSDQIAFDDSQGTPKNYATFYQGTGTVFNEDGENHDFRVESSGNANMLVVDANVNRVGIGVATPGSPLDVESSEAANTANFNSTNGATNITLESNGSLIGQMEFSGPGPSGIVTRTTASLAFGSNNVKTLYITDDDRVGIGLDGPGHLLDVTAADGASDNNPVARFVNQETTDGRSKGIYIRAGSTNDDFGLQIDDHDASATLLRFTGAGRLGINTISANAKLDIREGTNGQEIIHLDHTHATNQTFILFKAQSTTRGTISFNSSSTQTTYNATSDERVKENIKEVDNALSMVNKIPVKKFNFKVDKNKNTVIGYIGQELIKEYPQAVTLMEAEGYDDFHMVDNSKLVPVLMKAVQELSKQVEDQAKRIEELEN